MNLLYHLMDTDDTVVPTKKAFSDRAMRSIARMQIIISRGAVVLL
jgi:hypothetical protein